MNQLGFLENQYQAITLEEMYDINGGIIITIGGVTIALTLAAIAKGAAFIAGLVGGAYTVGYVIGQGWGHVVK